MMCKLFYESSMIKKKLVDLIGANCSNTCTCIIIAYSCFITNSPLYFHVKIDQFWYFHINKEIKKSAWFQSTKILHDMYVVIIDQNKTFAKLPIGFIFK